MERLFLPFVALSSLCEAVAGKPEMASRLQLKHVVTAGEQLQVRAVLPSCHRTHHTPHTTHTAHATRHTPYIIHHGCGLCAVLVVAEEAPDSVVNGR